LLRILVIGAGDIGLPIILYLAGIEHKVTVIEIDEMKCKKISDKADATIFNGSGSDSEMWKTIKAEQMDVLMALTNNDDVNMEAIKIAKEQYGIPNVIARARQPENIPHMYRLGANLAICPSNEVRRIFIDALEGLNAVILCQYMTPDFKSVMVTIPINGSIIGKTLEQLDLGEDCKVAALIREDKFLFPSDQFVLMGDDRVLLCGSSECVDKSSNKLRQVELT
jgi:Trk K+ transport system NAD-binding subunit